MSETAMTALREAVPVAPTERPATALEYFGRQRIEVIRNTIARGANDHELQHFLEVCFARGLDPFTRQVHWTRQGIILGIDGFRAQAERTGRYRPGDTRLEYDDNGKLVAAYVTVYRLHDDGMWHALTESAFLEEYAAPHNPQWRKMPRVMLAKCAEARAIRRAFPSLLSGLYSREEMDQADAPPRRVQGSETSGTATVMLDAEVEEETESSTRGISPSMQRAWVVEYALALQDCEMLATLEALKKEKATQIALLSEKLPFAVHAFEGYTECRLSGIDWRPTERERLAVEWVAGELVKRRESEVAA